MFSPGLRDVLLVLQLALIVHLQYMYWNRAPVTRKGKLVAQRPNEPPPDVVEIEVQDDEQGTTNTWQSRSPSHNPSPPKPVPTLLPGKRRGVEIPRAIRGVQRKLFARFQPTVKVNNLDDDILVAVPIHDRDSGITFAALLYPNATIRAWKKFKGRLWRLHFVNSTTVASLVSYTDSADHWASNSFGLLWNFVEDVDHMTPIAHAHHDIDFDEKTETWFTLQQVRVVGGCAALKSKYKCPDTITCVGHTNVALLDDIVAFDITGQALWRVSIIDWLCNNSAPGSVTPAVAPVFSGSASLDEDAVIADLRKLHIPDYSTCLRMVGKTGAEIWKELSPETLLRLNSTEPHHQSHKHQKLSKQQTPQNQPDKNKNHHSNENTSHRKISVHNKLSSNDALSHATISSHDVSSHDISSHDVSSHDISSRDKFIPHDKIPSRDAIHQEDQSNQQDQTSQEGKPLLPEGHSASPKKVEGDNSNVGMESDGVSREMRTQKHSGPYGRIQRGRESGGTLQNGATSSGGDFRGWTGRNLHSVDDVSQDSPRRRGKSDDEPQVISTKRHLDKTDKKDKKDKKDKTDKKDKKHKKHHNNTEDDEQEEAEEEEEEEEEEGTPPKGKKGSHHRHVGKHSITQHKGRHIEDDDTQNKQERDGEVQPTMDDEEESSSPSVKLSRKQRVHAQQALRVKKHLSVLATEVLQAATCEGFSPQHSVLDLHGNTLHYHPDKKLLYYNSRSLDTAIAIQYGVTPIKASWALGRFGNIRTFDGSGQQQLSLFYHSHGFQYAGNDVFYTFNNNYANMTNCSYVKSSIVEMTLHRDNTQLITAHETFKWEVPWKYFSRVIGGGVYPLPPPNAGYLTVVGNEPVFMVVTLPKNSSNPSVAVNEPNWKLWLYKSWIYSATLALTAPRLWLIDDSTVIVNKTHVNIDCCMVHSVRSHHEVPATLKLTSPNCTTTEFTKGVLLPPFWGKLCSTISVCLGASAELKIVSEDGYETNKLEFSLEL